MNALDSLLETPLAYHLGWTLVHFLWQGLLVGTVYACLRPLLKDASPQTRYSLSLCALGVLAALPLATFAYLLTAPVATPALVGTAAGFAHSVGPVQSSFLDILRQALRPLIPWTVPAWCTGVGLMAIKSFMAWRRARILTRKDAVPAPDIWQQTLMRLALRVGVRVHINLLVTAKVAVPCVVGWLKPVILLPPSAFMALTPLQLEMILAHELSHIRRLDYLVNLMQVVIETLLFYHPVVRWISSDVRRERELCCDDSAVQACGDALHYAHALTDLEVLRGIDMSPAMGVNGGDLMMRVERLIESHHAPAPAPRLTSVMLASTLCLSGMLALASARNMPASVLQSFALSLSQLHATGAAYSTPASGHAGSQLVPTLFGSDRRDTPRHAEIRRLQLDAVLLQPVTAPAELAATVVTTDPAPAAPVQVGGDSLASLLTPDSGSTAVMDVNKRAIAPIHIINMKGSDSPPPKTRHEHCEPITGSRVCN